MGQKDSVLKDSSEDGDDGNKVEEEKNMMNRLNWIKGETPEGFLEAKTLGEHLGEIVKIHGSVHKIRRMTGFAFVLIRQRMGIVQGILSPEYTPFPLEELEEELCGNFTVEVVPEERSKTGFDLRILAVEVLSRPRALSPVVLNQKNLDVNLETALNYRPLALRHEKERAVFKIQAEMTRSFREFFHQEGFTEIHTPKIVYAGAEGGANIFTLPYFGKEAFLAQSPQFYKQMMVGVFERVFEIGPVFRAEKHDTSRHLNEYTSVDLEMGYIASFEEIMAMETRMLRHLLAHLEENTQEELRLLGVTLPKVEAIPALKFAEAKALLWGEEAGAEFSPDLEPEEEKRLCALIYEETGSEFVFVTHYPTKKRPFYAMEDPQNPEETLSFDLLFRGVEITTGGQRIHEYGEQVAKMNRRGMTMEDFESYLMIHKHGMPPHGGLGLGLERLTSRLLQQDNVRRATLFPRDTQRLIP